LFYFIILYIKTNAGAQERQREIARLAELARLEELAREAAQKEAADREVAERALAEAKARAKVRVFLLFFNPPFFFIRLPAGVQADAEEHARKEKERAAAEAAEEARLKVRFLSSKHQPDTDTTL
jgi:hypothetical protein